MSPPFLTTDRLILRPITRSDSGAIQASASAREISDTMISIPHPYPDGQADRYISRRLSEMEKGLAATFVIELKTNHHFTGIIEIRDIEREYEQAELSFWLAVGSWGHGYISEAIKPVLQYAFMDLQLNRIYAHHMTRNPASGQALKKNGFREEGLLRQRVRKWDVFEDVVLLAILREDWEKPFGT
ncbi:MAG: GNAT family N-acetyltransferase [Chlorobiales bacterium]|jgi:[ribosomal protein S5]-alanine N-acetyltransferase|nr:GNAT family N-acetyltransferase [Chlorobiales bacterium]